MTFSRAQGVVVVDASAAIPFLQGDPAMHAAWQRWTADDDLVLVPPIFPLEVANALLRGSSIRSAARAVEHLDLLAAAGFEVADRGHDGLRRSIHLAATHGLTVYDAAYLDLAIDVDGALATLDRDLHRAAEAEGVSLLL